MQTEILSGFNPESLLNTHLVPYEKKTTFSVLVYYQGTRLRSKVFSLLGIMVGIKPSIRTAK